MQPIPILSIRTRTIVLAVLSILFTHQIQVSAAAPPANDTCGGAHTVPASGPFPYWTPVIDVSGAGTAGDPVSEVLGQTNLGHSVWYAFTPLASGLYTFSVGQDTATDFVGLSLGDEDTLLGVYTSVNGCAGSFTTLVDDDDSARPLRSAVSTDLQAGTTYRVVVWVGPITLALVSNQVLNVQLKVSKPTVPSNDNCAGAEEVPPSGPFPFNSTTNDTTLAGTAGLDISCAPSDPQLEPSRDVWFRFRPSVPGTYIFSTGSDTATTVGDTLLAIYTSAGSCAGPFTSVVCNDNTLGRAVVAQALNADTTYYIVVWDNEPEFIPGETSVQLRISQATPPTVGDLYASRITSTNVVLNGTFNPNGLRTRVWFEWGPTAGLGSTSQVRLVLGGTSPMPTNIPVSGFARDTTYFFRMVATNDLGKTVSTEAGTFRFSSVAPQITSAQRPSATRFYLRFENGNPGQLYSVEGSTNLNNPGAWTEHGFCSNPSGGPSNVFEFNHVGIGAAPNRFYRIKLP